MAGSIAGAILLLALCTTTPAQAASPMPSDEGGIVTVCPGNPVNLNGEDGEPLPLEQQQRLIEGVEHICNGDQPGGMSTFSVGDSVFAYLDSKPGVLTMWTNAVSLPANVDKTLDCEYQIGGGAWLSCGHASTYWNTYMSTSKYSFCPVPGLPVIVEAILHMNGVSHFDTVYGTTK